MCGDPMADEYDFCKICRVEHHFSSDYIIRVGNHRVPICKECGENSERVANFVERVYGTRDYKIENYE